MISWKHSFKGINEELELVKKKKQALDDLFNAGKISQTTYDCYNKELTDAIVEIEERQKTVLSKMSSKAEELEQQIQTLEMLLADSEIRHAAGEMDDEPYTHQNEVLTMGLKATKQELNRLQEGIAQFMPKEVEMAEPEVSPAPAPLELEATTPVETAVEETAELPTEPPLAETIETPQETVEVVEEATQEERVAPVKEAEEASLEEHGEEEPLEVEVKEPEKKEAPVEKAEEETVEESGEEMSMEENYESSEEESSSLKEKTSEGFS
ncbi:MAG: CdvA-like protein [Thermoproteota archaeon]|nr:CdvA-like protein [Thermoproteota archaeon]